MSANRIFHKTLWLYLFRSNLQYFIATFLGFVGIFLLVECFEVFSRFYKKPIIFSDFIKLVLLNIPTVCHELIVIISLVSIVFFLKRINEQKTFTLLLSNGLSIWNFIVPLLCSTIFMGFVLVIFLSSIRPYTMLQRSEIHHKIQTQNQNLTLNSDVVDVFLQESYNAEFRIVHTKLLDLVNGILQNVTIFIVYSNASHSYTQKIEADSCVLKNGFFKCSNVLINKDNQSIEHQNFEIQTRLSVDDFRYSVTPAKNIPLLQIYQQIKSLGVKGINVDKYKAYFYKEITKPLLMGIMALLSIMIFRIHMIKSDTMRIFISLFSGLTVFSIIEMLIKMLLSLHLQPLLSILLPQFVVLSIIYFIILHLHKE